MLLLANTIGSAMDTQRCLEILQLECVSSLDELKQAYRKAVSIWNAKRPHHDPRSEKSTEEKLREIRLAYQHLYVYFDPVQSRRLKASDKNSTFYKR